MGDRLDGLMPARTAATEHGASALTHARRRHVTGMRAIHGEGPWAIA